MTQVLAPKWDAVADELDEYASVETERVRYAVGIKPLLDLPRTARILEAGLWQRAVVAHPGGTRLPRSGRPGDQPGAIGLRSTAWPATAELVCASDVPFEPRTFDAVVSAAVIEHVTYPQRWLGELAQVVRPGGVVSIVTDTYMWRWLQRMGLYCSIQPLDQAIWPATLARWGREAGLRLEARGGFHNTPEQRYFFLKQLVRYRPRFKRLRWHMRRIRKHLGIAPRSVRPPADRTSESRRPMSAADETANVLEAFRLLPAQVHYGWWPSIWSYESFFWFRKV